MKTIYDGYDKDLWIKTYDDISLNFGWCLDQKVRTPLDITVEQATDYNVLSWNERLIEEAWKKTSGRTLELGAEWGRFAIYKILQSDMEFDAANASSVTADYITALAKNLNIEDKLRSHLILAEDITFEDDTFDNIYAFETMEHVGDLDKSLSEVLRVLKPGGSFLFTLPLYANYDGGYHTQQHSKEYWVDKFVNFKNLDTVVYVDKDQCIMGCLSK